MASANRLSTKARTRLEFQRVACILVTGLPPESAFNADWLTEEHHLGIDILEELGDIFEQDEVSRADLNLLRRIYEQVVLLGKNLDDVRAYRGVNEVQRCADLALREPANASAQALSLVIRLTNVFHDNKIYDVWELRMADLVDLLMKCKPAEGKSAPSRPKAVGVLARVLQDANPAKYPGTPKELTDRLGNAYRREAKRH